MAQVLIALFDKIRGAQDPVFDARLCALGQQPSSRRPRRAIPASPFRYVAPLRA